MPNGHFSLPVLFGNHTMPISEDVTWKNIIKMLREFSGKTQENFAREIGVRTDSVSRWERGNSNPGRLATRNIIKYYFLHKTGLTEKYMKIIEDFLERNDLLK